MLPWPGGVGGSDPEMELGPGEEGRGGLLRCGALLGVTMFCKTLTFSALKLLRIHVKHRFSSLV